MASFNFKLLQEEFIKLELLGDLFRFFKNALQEGGLKNFSCLTCRSYNRCRNFLGVQNKIFQLVCCSYLHFLEKMSLRRWGLLNKLLQEI